MSEVDESAEPSGLRWPHVALVVIGMALLAIGGFATSTGIIVAGLVATMLGCLLPLVAIARRVARDRAGTPST